MIWRRSLIKYLFIVGPSIEKAENDDLLLIIITISFIIFLLSIIILVIKIWRGKKIQQKEIQKEENISQEINYKIIQVESSSSTIHTDEPELKKPQSELSQTISTISMQTNSPNLDRSYATNLENLERGEVPNLTNIERSGVTNLQYHENSDATKLNNLQRGESTNPIFVRSNVNINFELSSRKVSVQSDCMLTEISE